MVKYTRLWETMQRKGVSQYRLIKTYGISNGQLNRLRKNLYISTHTVAVSYTHLIPKTDPLFTASLAVIPLQLMGYYVSVAKGLDVDKPRNLAKSVTVE